MLDIVDHVYFSILFLFFFFAVGEVVLVIALHFLAFFDSAPFPCIGPVLKTLIFVKFYYDHLCQD